MSIFHFPFQPSPRVSFGMELEPKPFQLDSNWKVIIEECRGPIILQMVLSLLIR
jgi:hypothetical protein